MIMKNQKHDFLIATYIFVVRAKVLSRSNDLSNCKFYYDVLTLKGVCPIVILFTLLSIRLMQSYFAQLYFHSILSYEYASSMFTSAISKQQTPVANQLQQRCTFGRVCVCVSEKLSELIIIYALCSDNNIIINKCD